MIGSYEDIKGMDKDIARATSLRNHRVRVHKSDLIVEIRNKTIDPVKALFICMEYLRPLQPTEPKNLSLYPFDNEAIVFDEYDLVEFLTGEFRWWSDLSGLSKRTDLVTYARERLLTSLRTSRSCEMLPVLEERLAILAIELIIADTFIAYYSDI